TLPDARSPDALRDRGGDSWPRSQGKPEPRLAPACVAAILEGQRTPVRFGDLPAQREADARSVRLGGEERHEQVGRVGQAQSVIAYPDVERAAVARPADGDAAVRLERRIGRVPHEVDEHLVQLIAVGGNG